MKSPALLCCLLAFLPGCLLGQSEPSAQPSGPTERRPDFRITSLEVRVDVIVADDKGRPVTDLVPDDFQILENKISRPVLNCTYVHAGTPLSDRRPAQPVQSAGVATPQTREVRRWISLIINDTMMSWWEIGRVKAGLRRFVNEQTGPHDAVSIMQVSGGAGAWLPFTSDKAVILRMIDQVHFRLQSNFAESHEILGFPGDYRRPAERSRAYGLNDRSLMRNSVSRLLNSFFTSLNPLMEELSSLEGKKLMIILDCKSGGAARDLEPWLDSASSEYERMLNKIQNRFADHAIRTGTTVYALNVSGLEVPGTDMEGGPPRAARSRFAATPDWNEVTKKTGGFYRADNTFLLQALKPVVEDSAGYYILSYRPSVDSFSKRFNRIQVRLKRRGLKARAAEGFFGVLPDAAVAGADDSERVKRALYSPFAHQDLDIKLTSLFAHNPVNGSMLRCWVAVDGRHLQLQNDADDRKTGSLEFQFAFFTSDNIPLYYHRTSRDVEISPGSPEQNLIKPRVFEINLTSMEPGEYILRVAVMDRLSKRLGSAYELVLIPSVEKRRLLLSGLVVGETWRTERGSERESGTLEAESGPGVRHFRPGSTIEYGFAVYNAGKDKKTGLHDIEYETTVYGEEGRVFSEKPDLELDKKNPSDVITVSGKLRLSSSIKAGHYVLQTVLTDKLANARRATVIRQMDFEVLE